MSYNGWENYETWLVNVEGYTDFWYNDFKEGIDECNSKKELNDFFNRMDLDSITNFKEDEDNAIYSISTYIKEGFEEILQNDIKDCSSIVQNFVGSCIDEVNWYELASHIYSDLKEVVDDKLNEFKDAKDKKEQNNAPK